MSDSNAVHVIDDDPAVRDSLVFLLRSADMQVTSHESAAAFLKRQSDRPGGCVITDIRMPDMDGLQLLRRLKAIDPSMQVIVITGHGDVAMAVEAMKMGASDFLEKPFDDEVLLASVRTALSLQARTDQHASELRAIHERLATLSARERQVLDGLVQGNANKAIAFDLGISPRTVEIYRANVMTKMNARTLSDLVRMTLLADLDPRAAG